VDQGKRREKELPKIEKSSSDQEDVEAEKTLKYGKQGSLERA